MNRVQNCSYLNKLENKFASERSHFCTILQLTIANAEWNNLIVSYTTADFGKYIQTINSCYLTIQNNVKNLHQATSSIQYALQLSFLKLEMLNELSVPSCAIYTCCT